MVLGDEQIGHCEIVAAGAAQPTDMPGIDHIGRCTWEQAQAQRWRVSVAPAAPMFVMGYAIAVDPLRVVDDAAISPSDQ